MIEIEDYGMIFLSEDFLKKMQNSSEEEKEQVATIIAENIAHAQIQLLYDSMFKRIDI